VISRYRREGRADVRLGSLQQVWAADSVPPAEGWKIWRVENEDGRVRLRSVLYGSLWAPERAAVADCKKLRRVRHDAPSPGCECGIHAAKELPEWSHYLRVGSGERVFGRVLVWGSLVEGKRGWRGAFAYPASIVVPAAVHDAEAVGEGLLAYGVPVEIAVRPSPPTLVGAAG
jgi:hypothetical protein